MSAGGRSALVQRDGELAVLQAAVLAAREAAGELVLVEGPPGIGKSALLGEAWGEAHAVGVDRLRARGELLEQRYAYGVVRQLLEPALSALSPHVLGGVLSGAAGEAASTLRGGPKPRLVDESEAQAVLLHGLYWIVAGLAERRPLLLVVDDAHWADDLSLSWLASLGRRLEDLPVTLIIAARSGDRGTAVIIDSVAATPGARLLRPQPLTASAVGKVLETRLHAPAEPAAARVAHARTGGNPLLVVELIKALDGAASLDRIAATAPPSIARIVGTRLGMLSRSARALAPAVAVLGDGAPLYEAAELAGIEPGSAASAASELIAADVLCDASDLTFRHSLVREAVLNCLTVPLRRAIHRRAAALLRDHHAPLERIAAQLLASDGAGEHWAVDVLRRAAMEALTRGGPDVAADLLARALNEPPPVEERAAVLAELGTAELRAGCLGGPDRLRDAIRMHNDPREQARLALSLGLELAAMQREREAAAVLAEGLARARDVDHELALRLEAHLAHAERYDLSGEATSAARLARLAASLRGETRPSG